MKLWELKPNQQAVIQKLIGVSDKVLLKIRDLGLQENETVNCIKWIPFGGPRVYLLENGVFAIDEFVANSIEIELVV